MSTPNLTTFTSAIAISALLSGTSALAADVPVKAAPIAVATVYNWTGIYGGVHVGYGKGRKEWVDSLFAYDVDGFIGGAQIGVNQQVGNFVFGLEADASWARIDGNQSVLFGGPAIGFDQTTTANTNIKGIVTVAGRAGFAQDRWLVYLKGGVAWVKEDHTFNTLQNIVVVGGPPTSISAAGAASETRFGAVVGIGSEFALWGNWSFKSEYNYIHLPHGSATLVGSQTFFGVTTPFAFEQTITQHIHLAKFGINYRFGPDAPPSIAPSRAAPGYSWTGAYLARKPGTASVTCSGRSSLPRSTVSMAREVSSAGPPA